MGSRSLIAASDAPACALGHRHAPANLTVEHHHVVPVAWQQFFKPETPPFPGTDPEGRGDLWDARTETLCPTSHRNVHFLIVDLMHGVQLAGVDYVPRLPNPVTRSHRNELYFAQQALVRFLAVGGSLLALVAGDEWGQA